MATRCESSNMKFPGPASPWTSTVGQPSSGGSRSRCNQARASSIDRLGLGVVEPGYWRVPLGRSPRPRGRAERPQAGRARADRGRRDVDAVQRRRAASMNSHGDGAARLSGIGHLREPVAAVRGASVRKASAVGVHGDDLGDLDGPGHAGRGTPTPLGAGCKARPTAGPAPVSQRSHSSCVVPSPISAWTAYPAREPPALRRSSSTRSAPVTSCTQPCRTAPTSESASVSGSLALIGW